MDDFEQFLKRQPARSLPREWRADVLAAAVSARKDHRLEPSSQPSAQITPWWLAWLWPSPIAWAGVACIWVLILGLESGSRPALGSTTLARASGSTLEIFATLAERKQLLQQCCLRLEEDSSEPPTPPSQPERRKSSGACNWRDPNSRFA